MNNIKIYKFKKINIKKSLYFFITHLTKIIKLIKDLICKHATQYTTIKFIKIF